MQEWLMSSGVDWSIKVGLALVIFIVGRIVVGILTRLIAKVLSKSGMDEMLVRFISSIAKALLLLVVFIAALDQLGVDTTSLVALIGAAGLAIGLALQNSLQNFASGVMLIVFRPFKSGDFVEMAGVSGVVEDINIFSSTLRSGDNKEIIVPNGDIYSGTIVNYSARKTRRIDMVFGIGYDDDLKKAKAILIEMLEADERVMKEPAPLVVVGELADASVNFNVRPWVKASDYWGVFFDMQENVKLRFDAEGISIPYPQMDVHVHQNNAE